MPNQSQSNKAEADDDSTSPAAIIEPQPARASGDQQELADSENDPAETDKRSTRKALWQEIRVIDVINCLVGLAMLAVAGATYRVASDTSDIKNAVRNISALAIQTKRQADNTSQQLAQTENALLATDRPWIIIPEVPQASFNHDDRVATLALSIKFKNMGRSPGGNGEIALRLLANIGGQVRQEFVRSNRYAGCPVEISKDGWHPFDAFSDSRQSLSFLSRRTFDSSHYLLICAHYDWGLDRDRRGFLVLLYGLSGSAARPNLDFLASYAG